MKWIFHSVLVSAALLTFSCENISSVKKEKTKNGRIFHKEIVYYNHFGSEEKDSTFWIGNDGTNLAEIEHGYYIYTALDSARRFIAPFFDIYKNQDFEIEISLTGVDDQLTNFYGIVIGEIGKDSNYIQFSLNSNGNYIVSTAVDKYKDRLTVENPNSMKRVRIECIDNEWNFFLNQKKIYHYPMAPISQLRFGPMTPFNSSVWVDYIKISRLVEQAPCVCD